MVKMIPIYLRGEKRVKMGQRDLKVQERVWLLTWA